MGCPVCDRLVGHDEECPEGDFNGREYAAELAGCAAELGTETAERLNAIARFRSRVGRPSN